MTSSFDRKVKLWDSATGQFIDSLQQNYNKTLPEPLAYFDLKKNYLYTKDRKKAFETEPLAGQDLDFNPFLYKQLTTKKAQDFPAECSNKEWNLHIDFKYLVDGRIAELNNILSSLEQNNCLNQ